MFIFKSVIVTIAGFAKSQNFVSIAEKGAVA
jgi:hypothetical protein